MIVLAYRMAATLLVLALTSGSAHAEIHKCRQGERIVYQSQPCPPGSQSLTLPDAPPPPSAYTVEEARSRAKNDIAEADALWKREEKAAEVREKARATTGKQESDCARLLGKIETAQVKAKPGKSRKSTLKSDQLKYRKLCGPL